MYCVIVKVSEEARRQREERERQEAKRAQLAKLEALAKREEQVWGWCQGCWPSAWPAATTKR